MSYQEQLNLLDDLSRGRKAKSLSHHLSVNREQKYQHYHRSYPKVEIPPRSTKAMLLTAMRKTQAIFKISSYGKGQERILAHLKYISRRGKLALEDQDGNKLSHTQEHKQLIDGWAHDFGNNTRSRDTMHIVLSTPPGTNRNSALEAAKQFLEVEYKKDGHDYVFVAHHDTDHPHVHAVIKMVSHFGNKLNPRKAYLRTVRERYADICRQHGIDVEASSRAERGLAGPSPKSEFIHMQRRGVRPQADIKLLKKVLQEQQNSFQQSHPSSAKMTQRNQIIRKRYADKANKLIKLSTSNFHKSKQEYNLQAATILHNYAKALPAEQTRAEKLSQQLKKHQKLQQAETEMSL